MVDAANQTLKDELDKRREAAELIAGAHGAITGEDVGGGGGGGRGGGGRGGGGGGGSDPAACLLKFQQGLLVFTSALLAAIFIGWPHYAVWFKTETHGFDTGQALIAWTADLLVVTAVLATLAAFVTQLCRKSIDSWSSGAGIVSAFLTALAVVSGGLAAGPYLLSAWARGFG